MFVEKQYFLIYIMHFIYICILYMHCIQAVRSLSAMQPVSGADLIAQQETLDRHTFFAFDLHLIDGQDAFSCHYIDPFLIHAQYIAGPCFFGKESSAERTSASQILRSFP